MGREFMTVKIMFFAAMRDAAGGKAEARLSLQEGATVGKAWEAVSAGNERLRAFERSMLCAVNAGYSDFSKTLRDGDVVAFFPPVSGG
jgi:molybdopterin converting factor subunit 1